MIETVKLPLALVADDSAVIRRVVTGIVAEFGFRVAEVADGAQALAFCKRETPTLVIFDWNIPVMSGLEFITALRATPDGHIPVVIVCTAENSVALIERAISAGANEYMMKPIDREILRDKLVQTGLIAE